MEISLEVGKASINLVCLEVHMGRVEEYRWIICMLSQMGLVGQLHIIQLEKIQIMIQTAEAAVIIYDASGWRGVLAAESSRSFAVAALACHAQRRGWVMLLLPATQSK